MSKRLELVDISRVSGGGWVTGYRLVPRAGQPMTYKQLASGSRKLFRELHTTERIVIPAGWDRGQIQDPQSHSLLSSRDHADEDRRYAKGVENLHGSATTEKWLIVTGVGRVSATGARSLP